MSDKDGPNEADAPEVFYPPEGDGPKESDGDGPKGADDSGVFYPADEDEKDA